MKIELTKNEIIAVIIASEYFLEINHFKKEYQDKALNTAHWKLLKTIKDKTK